MTPEHIAFLNHIRAAVADTTAERLPLETLLTPANDGPLLAALAGRTQNQRMELLQQLIANAAPLNLQVTTCSTLPKAAGRIAAITLASEPEFSGQTALILHEHPLLQALALDSLTELEDIPKHWTSRANTRVRAHTLAASIGITVADWGIAESATIVQLTRPGRPRSTSLVPSVHIALLPLSRLVADLAEAFALVRREPEHASMVLISGPSKTADIEACMVLGAHGPRAMHLLVLTGAADAAASSFLVASCNQCC
jgi:L-lactate dehydrogenase complex protein LldG